MTTSTIQQELEKYREDVKKFAGQVYERAGDFENMTEHDNDTIQEFYKDRLNEAIQKSVEEAEKRIDEEFKENYSANVCKIVAKQIIRDVFGVDEK